MTSGAAQTSRPSTEVGVVDRSRSRMLRIAERVEDLRRAGRLRTNRWHATEHAANDADGSSAGFVRPVSGDDFIIDTPEEKNPDISAFVLEQYFDGSVLSVNLEGDCFEARIVDRSASNPDEEAEFLFDEISQDDRPLIVPGALFTWHIGLQRRRGTSMRVSDIRFRRLPPLSKEDLDSARTKGSQLSERLKVLNERADNWTEPGRA